MSGRSSSFAAGSVSESVVVLSSFGTGVEIPGVLTAVESFSKEVSPLTTNTFLSSPLASGVSGSGTEPSSGVLTSFDGVSLVPLKTVPSERSSRGESFFSCASFFSASVNAVCSLSNSAFRTTS